MKKTIRELQLEVGDTFHYNPAPNCGYYTIEKIKKNGEVVCRKGSNNRNHYFSLDDLVYDD